MEEEFAAGMHLGELREDVVIATSLVVCLHEVTEREEIRLLHRTDLIVGWLPS